MRTILDDEEASDNDKFVAFDLIKNDNIAAGGVLPMCQDTGAANKTFLYQQTKDFFVDFGIG